VNLPIIDGHSVKRVYSLTEVIPFPDVKGHIVGVVERRGVAVFEDGEISAIWR